MSTSIFTRGAREAEAEAGDAVYRTREVDRARREGESAIGFGLRGLNVGGGGEAVLGVAVRPAKARDAGAPLRCLVIVASDTVGSHGAANLAAPTRLSGPRSLRLRSSGKSVRGAAWEGRWRWIGVGWCGRGKCGGAERFAACIDHFR
jgi:hypothetical protein